MFPEYVKSAMDERERSIQELLRDRRIARSQPTSVRWRAGSNAAQRRPNEQRGL
jgi:hypothetical protein